MVLGRLYFPACFFGLSDRDGYTFWAGRVSGILRATRGRVGVASSAEAHIVSIGIRVPTYSEVSARFQVPGETAGGSEENASLVRRIQHRRDQKGVPSSVRRCKSHVANFSLFIEHCLVYSKNPDVICGRGVRMLHVGLCGGYVMQYVLEGGEAALRLIVLGLLQARRYLDPCTRCWEAGLWRHGIFLGVAIPVPIDAFVAPRRRTSLLITTFEFSVRIVPCRPGQHH